MLAAPTYCEERNLMRSESETRKLAEDHWGFTGGVLKIVLPDPVPKEVVMELTHFIHNEVWVHGVKHDRVEADG